MELTPVQQRIVGALVEKERTTPDNYPLSMNALLAACNQTTNRDPVADYDERVVSNALENLKSAGIVRVVYSRGMRVDKYRHVLPEALGVDGGELALLTVMLLRGPQTVAELRTRTERLHAFAVPADLDAALDGLARREPALAVLHARRPGQKEPRWMHLLAADPSDTADAEPAPPPWAAPVAPVAPVAPGPSPATPPAAAPPQPDRLAELEARVAALEARLDDAGF